ncbi:hypothetical protein RFI_03216, partial [Reticulomyxa filosa]
ETTTAAPATESIQQSVVSRDKRNKGENKEKDTTEQNNANETKDKEDDKHSKESLEGQWKALFKTIVFERGNRSRGIDTKAITRPKIARTNQNQYESD